MKSVKGCVIGLLIVVLVGLSCRSSAEPVKTSRFPWINTWGVEYYFADGTALDKDVTHFDLHMSPHNLQGLKAKSPKNMALLYSLWREQYVSSDESAVKERRKMRLWTTANRKKLERFYCHYGRDVTIKGTNPKTHEPEEIVVPGWDSRNDINNDDIRDMPADYGKSTGVGAGYLEDSTKSWRPNEWQDGYLVDKDRHIFKVTGNTPSKLLLSGDGTPTEGRYGLSAKGSKGLFSTARTKSRARVKTYIWQDYAYAMNLGNPDYRSFRIYDAKKLLVEADKTWDKDASNLWDGFMIDNTQPEFPWAEVVDGTELILEYPRKTKWREDQVALVKAVREAIPTKLMVGNTGSYDYVEIADAGGGQHQEQYVAFTNEHGPAQWDYWKQQSDKGIYSLVLPSYGCWPNDPDRERMHYLAFHYIGQQPYIYLGFRGFGYIDVYHWDPSPEDWLPAAEVDVGTPLEAKYKQAASGKDPTGQDYRIYTRRYSKALIVCRPKIEWSDENYGNNTGVTFDLPSHSSGNRYKPLKADGTFGQPVSKVTLRHPESWILFPVETASGADGNGQGADRKGSGVGGQGGLYRSRRQQHSDRFCMLRE